MKNKETKKDLIGISIALIIIFLWCGNLYYIFSKDWTAIRLFNIINFFLQIQLFTGLFITAHDAMHQTLAPHFLRVNNFIGAICTNLYAFFSFDKLKKKHYLHHQFVATDKDPDFSNENIFAWYGSFLKEYISLQQIIGYAIAFNILKIFVDGRILIIFWIVPAIMSTSQLFYFGTYQPHNPHPLPNNIHKSRTQSRNHLWAFLSCYFFGYHFEHHDKPFVPWWELWKYK
ncbi:MAG: fatty acid desaturase [Chitinophagales bacterium]|nr:fatty acid desaturase [Chitinophagales bacterium]